MKGQMYMTRREVREGAFILLFEMELNNLSIEETLEATIEAFELVENNDTLKIVKGVTEHKDEFDEEIGKYSPKRSVARISRINITLLRIALYEIKYDSNVPPKVAINEAIELAKKYADENDKSFISGILGSYYKDIEADAE